MAADIALWKDKSPKIHRDDIFRAYSGCKLMKGAKQLVSDLKEAGIYVAIVSAGVDLYVQSIAAMVQADDWIANGFEFDDDGPYVGSTDTWSLDDCTSDWKAVLSEDSNYDKEEIEYKLNFVSGEHYLNDEGWEYLDGSFGKTVIVFEGEK